MAKKNPIKEKLWEEKKDKDSRALFEAAWREILKFARHSMSMDEAVDCYETIVGVFVNNPKSKFYIHG